MCDIKSFDSSRHHRRTNLRRAHSPLPGERYAKVTALLPFKCAAQLRSSRFRDMKPIITSFASLFVTSILSHKVKAKKEGIALLLALGLVLGGAATANSVSEKKWQAPATAAAKKNPVAASQSSNDAGQKMY